jgi:hypothetical protein
MPASTNPNYGFTAAQLMLSAAYELGAIGMGDTLEDSEENEMLKRLNSMLAQWSVDANLFRETSATITISGGAGAATLPRDVRDVRSVRVIQSATYKRALAPWNRDQYFQIPNRSTAGAPLAFYYSQQTDGDQLYVWPIPADDTDFELDYSRSFFFVEDTGQTLDIPPEWHEAALYGLAARCSNLFGTTRLDPSTVMRVDAQSRETYQKLLDADRPDSYYFEYDSPVEAR